MGTNGSVLQELHNQLTIIQIVTKFPAFLWQIFITTFTYTQHCTPSMTSSIQSYAIMHTAS